MIGRKTFFRGVSADLWDLVTFQNVVVCHLVNVSD